MLTRRLWCLSIAGALAACGDGMDLRTGADRTIGVPFDDTPGSCGGSYEPACPAGHVCTVDDQCASAICDADEGVCRPPTALDGVRNGDETDVDCGGAPSKAPRCATGAVCSRDGDCASGSCDAQKRCR